MRSRPGVIWTIAGLIALLLFYVPLVNGIVAGAFGGWFEPEPKKAAGHAIIAAVVLFVLQWMMQLYGAVWFPFAGFSGTTRAALCAIPLLVTAVLVCVARTTHKSPAV